MYLQDTSIVSATTEKASSPVTHKDLTMADLIVAIKENRLTDVTRRLSQESNHNLKMFINFQDRDSHETMLFCACIKGHLRLAKFLLDRGARVDLRTCWGASPIHAASEKGHDELVRLLLTYGSGVNWQTSYGDTPLHLASYKGHYEVVKCLVENGCNIDVINSKGKTAAVEANNGGNRRIVQYLMLLQATENTTKSGRKGGISDAMCTKVLAPPVGHNQNQSSIKITKWHTYSQPSSTNELKRHQTWKLRDNHAEETNCDRLASHESKPQMLCNDLGSDFRLTKKCAKKEMHQNVVHAPEPEQNKRDIISSSNTERRAEQRDVSSYSEKHRISYLEKAVSDLQQGLVTTQEELAKTQTELKETQQLLHRFRLNGVNIY